MRRIVILTLLCTAVWPALADDLQLAKDQLSRELSECAAYYYTLSMPQEVEAETRERLLLAGRRARALSASLSGERRAHKSMERAMDAMVVRMRFDWSNTGVLREQFEDSCDYLVENPGRRLLTWVDRYTEVRQAASETGAGHAVGVLGNVSSAVAATVPLAGD
jgi:hypothetical protein